MPAKPSPNHGEGDVGGIKVRTNNTSSYKPMMELAKDESHKDGADIILVQEHRLGEAEIPEYSQRLYSLGWRSAWAPAISTLANSWSSGTAILWKKHIPI